MKTSLENEFHPLSIKYMNQTELSHRKKHGQYFTPQSIRELLLSFLPQINSPVVLDPACGSGEFLLSASKKWKNPKLVGWELESQLVKLAQQINPSAIIKNIDTLQISTSQKFDFIIGNPPYFEMKLSDSQKSQFQDIVGGRMNIFSLFIKISLDHLKEDGYLGFVVPPSMNNGAFFSNLRNFIINTAEIVKIKIISSPSIFSNAQQQVMILILKKQKNTGKYLFRKNGIAIFTPNKSKLLEAYKGKSTLFEQGFSVKTGSIVWNNNKKKLTNSAQNNQLLIWAHNLADGKLVLHNSPKPQYIISEQVESGPVILVNRVTGTSSQAKIRAVFVPKSTRFLAENHVNIINPPAQINGKKVSVRLLKSIAKQISSDENCQLIKLITGNTQLSKNELWKLIPLDFSD